MANTMEGRKLENILRQDGNEIVYEVCEQPSVPVLKKKLFFQNLIRTSLVYFAHACMGLLLGLGGPAFLDILQITGTNVKQGSIYFTAQYLGILISGAGAGPLYDRYHAEPILMTSVIASGVLNIIVPYCSRICLMAFVNCIKGAAMGIVFIGVGAVVQRIWGKAQGGPYQQALHFAFSVGGIMAPVIMRPFLATRIAFSTMTSQAFNLTTRYSITTNASTATNLDILGTNNTVIDGFIYGATRVHSGFLIIGVITVFSGFTLMGMSITDRHTFIEKYVITKPFTSDDTRTETVGVKNCLTLRLRVLFLIAIVMYYVLIVASETLIQNYLMPFVVKHLKWTKSLGAQLMSVYWGSFSAGRFLGIVEAKFLTPWKIIAIDLVMFTGAIFAFLLGAEKHSELIWICTVVSGVFVASLFAAGVTFVDHRIMGVTGKVYAVIIMAATSGAMINPLILGALIQAYSERWFLFLGVILCLINLIVFAVLTAIVHKWGRKSSN